MHVTVWRSRLHHPRFLYNPLLLLPAIFYNGFYISVCCLGKPGGLRIRANLKNKERLISTSRLPTAGELTFFQLKIIALTSFIRLGSQTVECGRLFADQNLLPRKTNISKFGNGLKNRFFFNFSYYLFNCLFRCWPLQSFFCLIHNRKFGHTHCSGRQERFTLVYSCSHSRLSTTISIFSSTCTPRTRQPMTKSFPYRFWTVDACSPRYLKPLLASSYYHYP